MIIHMDKPIPRQPPEKEEGNKEYKRFLYCKDTSIEYQNDFINKRASQMLYRLIEGKGKAVYLLGVDDDGKIYSLNKKIMNDTIRYIKKI